MRAAKSFNFTNTIIYIKPSFIFKSEYNIFCYKYLHLLGGGLFEFFPIWLLTVMQGSHLFDHEIAPLLQVNTYHVFPFFKHTTYYNMYFRFSFGLPNSFKMLQVYN